MGSQHSQPVAPQFSCVPARSKFKFADSDTARSQLVGELLVNRSELYLQKRLFEASKTFSFTNFANWEFRMVIDDNSFKTNSFVGDDLWHTNTNDDNYTIGSRVGFDENISTAPGLFYKRFFGYDNLNPLYDTATSTKAKDFQFYIHWRPSSDDDSSATNLKLLDAQSYIYPQYEIGKSLISGNNISVRDPITAEKILASALHVSRSRLFLVTHFPGTNTSLPLKNICQELRSLSLLEIYSTKTSGSNSYILNGSKSRYLINLNFPTELPTLTEEFVIEDSQAFSIRSRMREASLSDTDYNMTKLGGRWTISLSAIPSGSLNKNKLFPIIYSRNNSIPIISSAGLTASPGRIEVPDPQLAQFAHCVFDAPPQACDWYCPDPQLVVQAVHRHALELVSNAK